MLSKLSKIIAVVAFFIVATLLLWLVYNNGMIPEIIFMLGFGLIILIAVFIMFYPGRDEFNNVVFIKKKKRKR